MIDISRRGFVRQSGIATIGGLLLPNFLSNSPNSIVNVAVVGVGGRGSNNWTQMLGIRADGRRVKAGLEEAGDQPAFPHVRIVAFCDVNELAAANSYEKLPDVPRFKDFRKMLDTMHKDIDAVIVSTPDHTHFAATMAAMEMGKHVYVEKPLAHNIWQLRTLKKAADYYGVVTQMGNQAHASDGIRHVKDWYDSGVLGEVREVMAWFNGPRFDPKGWFSKPNHYPPHGETIPDSLDWNLWLGPAAERPYSSEYLPRFWRSYYELGTGMLGDWGCHTLDAPFWSLDLGMPETIEPLHVSLSQSPNHFLPNESILEYKFPVRNDKAAVTLSWYEGGKKPEVRPEWGIAKLPANGFLMIGDKQTVIGGGKPYSPRILMPAEEWTSYKKKGWESIEPRVPRESPHDEFIAAIRGTGPKPGSSFEYGADLTEVALLGSMAQRFNAKLEYDAENMAVTNQPALDAYIKEEVRDGWSYGENIWQ